MIMRWFLSFVCAVCALGVSAQKVADSVRFCHPLSWKIVAQERGLIVRELRSKLRDERTLLFDVAQHIYVMEVDPVLFRFEPARQLKKQRVSSLCRSGGAVAGVNGGFFVIDPAVRDTAVAGDFLKIRGVVSSPVPSTGWGSAAVGFDENHGVHFTHWSKQMESQDSKGGWSAACPNVMAAGPMIIYEGKSLCAWENIEKKSLTKGQKRAIYAPRTAIGVRADGRVVLLVVDGRRPKAYGASMAELATIGRWLSLTCMLNLDGGGSSTMIYGGSVVNFPSDFMGVLPIERSVANALLVIRR